MCGDDKITNTSVAAVLKEIAPLRHVRQFYRRQRFPFSECVCVCAHLGALALVVLASVCACVDDNDNDVTR